MTNIETHTQVTLQIGYTGNKEARAMLHLQATMPVPESVDLLDTVPHAIRSRAVAEITEMLIGDDLRKLREIHYRLALVPDTQEIASQLLDVITAYGSWK